jgi:CBS domain-containing protein
LPRYFLHLHEKDLDCQDEEGVLLIDDSEAMAAARAGARSLVADAVMQAQPIGHERIDVVDADGRLVGSVTLREVIKFEF